MCTQFNFLVMPLYLMLEPLYFRETPRGQQLISSVSILYAFMMAVLCFAMLLAKVLEGDDAITSKQTDVSK